MLAKHVNKLKCVHFKTPVLPNVLQSCHVTILHVFILSFLSHLDTHEPPAKQMKVALTIGLVVSAVLILGIIAVAVVYYLWSRQQQRRKNIQLAQKCKVFFFYLCLHVTASDGSLQLNSVVGDDSIRN